jgi:hypothetical protein
LLTQSTHPTVTIASLRTILLLLTQRFREMLLMKKATVKKLMELNGVRLMEDVLPLSQKLPLGLKYQDLTVTAVGCTLIAPMKLPQH